MSKIILSWLVLLFLVCAVFATPRKLIIFGDSLSDTGNTYAYSQHQKPPKPLYFQGRYSDGLIWVDYVAQALFPSHPEQHFLNYAFAGAGITQCQASSFTLRQEIDSYLLAHTKPNQNDWFVIWIGANDYLLHPEINAADIEKVIAEFMVNITRLLQHGARQMMIIGLPDLGRLPFAHDFDMSAQLTHMTDMHNDLLRDGVSNLRKKFPEYRIFYQDIRPVFDDLMMHPKRYGLTQTSERCFIPGQQQKYNCSKYVFLDQFHPTSTVHKVFAEYIESAANW